MRIPKTLVVTIPGMIFEKDLLPLKNYSDINYMELRSISEGDLAAACAGHDYLMLNMDVLPTIGKIKLSEIFYSHLSVKSLKSIAIDMTGMDYFSPKAALANGVMLQNIPHYSSQSVAETVVSEILLHSRQRHLAYVDELKQRPIEPRKGINLVNRTAGIVGFGSIGSRVAGLLAGMGMKVIAWNRSQKAGMNFVSLEKLFESSQVICISVKTVLEGNDSNQGMIGYELLRRGRGLIMVNLANHAIIQSNAMSSAITSGNVASYSVEDNPEVRQILGRHESVHFAPHNSWNSDESMQALRDTWVSNIITAIQGNPANRYVER